MKGSVKSERGRLRRAVVVGAGRTGLSATLELCARGVPVLLMSLGPSHQAQSARDREGFNACAASERDSATLHAEDTLRAGNRLARLEAVTTLATRAPELFEWLAGLGVPFSRTTGGTPERLRLSGSRVARTLYAGAHSGRHILSTLDALVRTQESVPATEESGVTVPGEKLVRRLEYWRFVALVLDDHGNAVGVLAQDCRTLGFKAFPADGVILATGDYAALFPESASNASCNGAALGAVYRQGAVLSNLEFVQQHPLVVVRDGRGLALPELLRAVGARIANRDGDSRARSLDLTPLDPASLASWIDSLGPALTGAIGVDLSRESVGVQSRPQRGLGGLWVDSDVNSDGFSPRQHATSITGLYAAGAAAAQYHGASVLAGNLAPADLLGGQLAARGVLCFREALAKSAQDLPKSLFDKPAIAAESEFEALLRREAKAPENPHALYAELGSALESCLGPEANPKKLAPLSEVVAELGEKSRRAVVKGPSSGWNHDATSLASLSDVLGLAQALSASASWRTRFTAQRASLVRQSPDQEPELIEAFEYECAGEQIKVNA